MESEILKYVGDLAFYGCLVLPFALVLTIFVVYSVCMFAKWGYEAIRDIFSSEHGPHTVIPKLPPPPEPSVKIIKNPATEKPNKQPITVKWVLPKNCIIINGEIFVYLDADCDNYNKICGSCALKEKCERERRDDMTPCDLFGDPDRKAHFIKLEDG